MSALPPKAGCPLSAKSGHGSHVMCAQTLVTKERLPPEANQVEQGLFCCFDEWLPKIAENEYANCGRQIAVTGGAGDLSYQRGNCGVFVEGNLMQGAPKLVFQRHARFMSIDENGTLDNMCFLGVLVLVHRTLLLHDLIVSDTSVRL